MNVLLLLAACLATARSDTNKPLVKTSKGDVYGSQLSNDVTVFTQIPFAKPPVGKLRFLPPETPDSWSTPLDGAGEYSASCIQSVGSFDIMGEWNNISENCLYLNVLTKNLSASLPVMVWIYGGSYTFGGAAKYPMNGIARNLVSREVVVVTFNYRLNAFGFLNIPNTDVPANVGMYDMIKVLQWVQDEVGRFGGDPSRVTIFGESAGSSSVSILTYSPLAKGLFKYAIMESGTAYIAGDSIWSTKHIMGMATSRNVVTKTNCMTTNEWEFGNNENVLECLQSKSTQQIVDATLNVETMNNFVTPWGPKVDGELLSDRPENIDRTGNGIESVMIGGNSGEASLWRDNLFFLDPNHSYLLSATNKSFFGEIDLLVYYLYYPNTRMSEINQLLDFHYGQQEWAQSSVDGHFHWSNATINMLSDWFMNYGIVKDALLAQKSDIRTYLYSFDYLSTHSPWAQYIQTIPHAYEMLFVFDDFPVHGTNWTTKNADDRIIVDLVGTMWTNFAKTGCGIDRVHLNYIFMSRDPNTPTTLVDSSGSSLQWSQDEATSPLKYLSITPTPRMISSFHYDAFTLWNDLVDYIAFEPTPGIPITTSTPINEGHKVEHTGYFVLVQFFILMIIQ